MKKITFYTMKNVNKKRVAVLVNGYTDGEYNYYSCGEKYKTWCAIVPALGLAVGRSCEKLKETAASANDPAIKESVKKYMKTLAGREAAENFENLIKAAC